MNLESREATLLYYIDKSLGIFTKNNDVISNEKLVTVLSNQV